VSYDVLTPEAALLWPYAPDWSGGFNVTRSFSTDIFDSRDKTEQRRATRHDPRFSIDYRTFVTGSDLQPANRWLRTWQNKSAIVPDYARWARLTGDSDPADTELTVSPMPAWVAAGQRLVLCGDTMEDVLVDSVAGDTITLDEPLTGDWNTGAVLRPTFFGLLEGKIASTRVTKGVAQIRVGLAAYPGGEPPRAAGTAWATLDGYEVFTPQPTFTSPPSFDYLWPVDEVDFDRGRTAQFRPVTSPSSAREADFQLLDVTAATELEQFFDRMKGRRGAFWLSTGEHDASFVSAAAMGGTTLTVDGLDIANEFGAVNFAQVRLGLSICLADGTDIYRRISDIAPSGSDTLITISGTWPATMNSGNVSRISWLQLARMGSDTMTMAWKTPLQAGTRLSFQTVSR
jgi:hypothetical protein